MALITKTYWKWDSRYNIEPCSLGKSYAVETLQESYEQIDKEGERLIFCLKNNANIKLVIRHNIIVQKSYFRGFKVEGLAIERDVQTHVQHFLEQHLERCDQSYQGEKLILGYLDGILGVALLQI